MKQFRDPNDLAVFGGDRDIVVVEPLGLVDVSVIAAAQQDRIARLHRGAGVLDGPAERMALDEPIGKHLLQGAPGISRAAVAGWAAVDRVDIEGIGVSRDG